MNHNIKLKCAFMCLILKQKWMRKMRRRGKTPARLTHMRLKLCLTVLGMTRADNSMRAKHIFKDVLVEVLGIDYLISKFYEWLK